jgi:hypothetical protein
MCETSAVSAQCSQLGGGQGADLAVGEVELEAEEDQRADGRGVGDDPAGGLAGGGGHLGLLGVAVS